MIVFIKTRNFAGVVNFSFAMQEVQLQSIDKDSEFDCVDIDGVENLDGFCKTRDFIHFAFNNHERKTLFRN